jgi:hypothetical protein
VRILGLFDWVRWSFDWLRFSLSVILVALAVLLMGIAQRVDEEPLIYWVRLFLADMAKGLEDAPAVWIVPRGGNAYGPHASEGALIQVVGKEEVKGE